MADPRAPHRLRHARSNSSLRRLLVAYGGAALSEWAVWLAALVDAHERSGSAAAGWMALALLVPAVVAAPFAGRAFGGAHPVRVFRLVLAGQAVALVIAAVAATLDGPLLAVAVPTAIAIGGISFVRPGQAVLAPTVVRSARELTTANLYVGYCDSGCVLVAPLVATAVLALGGPSAVFALCAVIAVAGVVATATLRGAERRAVHEAAPPVESSVESSVPAAATAATAPTVAATTPLRDLVDELRTNRHAGALLTVLSLQHVVMGVVGLMFVVLATDELDMGASGAGVLNIAFGVGAVASGVVATVLAGRGRLAPVAVGCVVLMAVSATVLGLSTTVPGAIVCLGVIGFGRSLLDVSARMLLQRTVPPHHLAASFAAIEILTAVGLFIGTIYTQVIAATVGAPRGLLGLALFLAGVLALTVRRLWKADEAADVPVVAVALLKSMPVFAPLPAPALEAVARRASERTFAPGEVIIRQGEPGETFHAIAGGRVDVDIDGRHIRTLGRGDGVGEVALLLDSPRTASVVAVEPTQTFELEREPFLTAVTGHEPSFHTAHRRIASLEF